MNNSQKLKPIIILGGGGHASVLADILQDQNRVILAIISPDDVVERGTFNGITHYRHDDDVLKFEPSEVLLVNGIGALPRQTLRNKISQRFLKLGYHFESVIASSATVSPYAQLESGVQVLHGAIIQAGVTIGKHSIINTSAIIEHDCHIGVNNHIAPRATLCGQVFTGQNVYVGAGATIIQNLKVGSDSLVGAGVTITRNLASEYTAYTAIPTLRKR